MILRECQAGFSFNPRHGSCDSPQDIPCDVSRCCSPEATPPVTSQPVDEDQVNVLPSERDPDCPAEGTAKLPYSENCTLYFVCNNGWKTIHSCPVGLYFNPLIKECDWPFDEIVCEPKPADLALLRSGLPAHEGGSSEPHSKTDICYGKCPFPDPKDRTVHLPANDCTKFCKCSNGVPYPMKCPKGLRYDRKKQVCNWKWAVKCEDDLTKDKAANPAGTN
ncbi:Chondroitin proteoglycan-2 [Harpegnathos saltator]|uniref:Chondroitin proteoglycan-2 n=2 Tax=Harpegnathos saltator TaxID=610380 RepID=E2C4I0_HARSA|nr:Chondroitin proteoglycan-2 [Harpegnathos saltator]